MAFDPQDRAAGYPAGRTVDRAEIDEGLRRHMLRIYNYMAGGLAVSGVVALTVASVPAVTSLFFEVVQYQGLNYIQATTLGWVAMFAPLGLLLIAAFGMRNASAATIQTFYWAFVGLQGISLATLLFLYTGESVVRVFFITSAAFAGLSLYGYTTRRSLSAFGSFLIMGLIGLIIAAVVNIFLASPMLQFVISAAGVLIFSGLIAYDTQRLKEEYSASHDTETSTKLAVWGALSLYIDFINLFRFLLYFLGSRE